MCTGRQWWQRRKRRWRRSEPRTAFPWLSKFSSSLNSRLSFGAEEVQNRTKARDRAEEALQDDKKDPRARARRGGRPSGPQQIWTESDSRRYSIATEVCSNPNSRLYLSNLSKRVTSPNHRSGSDRLREVGQLTSCGGPRCSPLRPTSRREATRASHGRNTANACLPRTEAGEANSPRQERPRCAEGGVVAFIGAGGRRQRAATAAAGSAPTPPVTRRPRAAPVRKGREEKEACHATRERRQEGEGPLLLGLEGRATVAPPAVATTPAKNSG